MWKSINSKLVSSKDETPSFVTVTIQVVFCPAAHGSELQNVSIVYSRPEDAPAFKTNRMLNASIIDIIVDIIGAVLISCRVWGAMALPA